MIIKGEPEIVRRARSIAERAHANQLDQAGRPYLEHVCRVAAAVQDDPVACALAWVHDVKEDHPDYAAEINSTFDAEFVTDLDLLTRKDSNVEAYYSAIRQRPRPHRVKNADVDDNANPERLALLDPALAARLRRKYEKARVLLNSDRN